MDLGFVPALEEGPAMPTPEAPAKLVASRPFLAFEGARFAATIALQAQGVVVAWLVYERSRSFADLGLVGLAQFLPSLVLLPVSGSAADRVDRRTLVLVAQALALAVTVGLARAASGSPAVAPVLALLVVHGVARAFLGPALQAILPSLVDERILARAVAVHSTVWEIASLAGPAAGGLALAAIGAEKTLLACAVALAGSIGLYALLPSLRVKADPCSRDVFAGLRFVRGHRLLLGAMSLDLLAVLFGGVVALLPAFAKDVLHAGPEALGLLRSAPAIGAVTTAAFLSARPITQRAGTTMLAAVFLFGAATAGFAFTTSVGPAWACLAVAGAADMVSVVVRMSIVPMATPAELRGRVSAVNLVFIGASNELGEFESGMLASVVGLVPAAAFGGLAACAFATAWFWLFPELRRIERPEDARAAA
jgi:MFS family permease